MQWYSIFASYKKKKKKEKIKLNKSEKRSFVEMNGFYWQSSCLSPLNIFQGVLKMTLFYLFH